MSIYETTNQNDPIASFVVNIGIGIDSPETNENKIAQSSWEPTPEEISEILTWGCLDSSISFTLSGCNFSNFIEEGFAKTRKIDLKNKKQWID